MNAGTTKVRGKWAVVWLMRGAMAYVAWLIFLVLHEFGHVLHAWISGGRVVSVSVPLLGFSQTVVHPNPHELFVVWGGPIWGVIIPLLTMATAWVTAGRVPHLLRFFAGLCLIGNGAYIGAGWIWRSGDAGDLVRLGTPLWLMIAFGAVCLAAGLYCWHHTRLAAPAVAP